jgi:predicted Fe-Mo cluster-binding NifX family protein
LKIVIPVWEEKVSPLLDTAGRLLLVEAENRAVASSCEVLLDEADLSRRCFRIWRLKADVLICGAVSRAFARLLAAEPGLTIIQGISGPAQDVLQAFLRGRLNRPRFMMPGSRSWQPRSGGLT